MKKNGFLDLSIKKLVEGLRTKAISSVEVAKICIDQVERFESKCLAWECFDGEKLLERARITQEYIDKGGAIRSLEGVPLGVKDIFNTMDFPTEMGSIIWKDFTPGNDARVISYIKWAGGIIPGKTVTAEFAVHALTKTLNPHNSKLAPGTSSSGSAVAVAAGMVPFALGTQTAGSIVRPASFCGIYGCKPSFGLIPRTGILKTTDSLDAVGFFTAHFEDLEEVFNVARVHGRNYPFSFKTLNDKDRQNKPQSRPWRVALVKTHTWQSAPSYAQEAFLNWANELSKDNDIEVYEKELPQGMESSHDVHATIYDCALAYYFKVEALNHKSVSSIMNEIIAKGNEITVEQYKTALEKQEDMADLMDKFLQKYDITISLSTAGEAPLRGDFELPDPALIWSLTYLPVIAAPVFVSPSNHPFGIQLVARRYNDLLLHKFTQYLCSKASIPKGANPKSKSLDNE